MDIVALVDEGLGNSAYVVDLGDGASGDTVPETSLLVQCGHGERAMSSASLLRRAGHDDVTVLAGGSGDLETGAEA
jgi:rhodanese-related sulfurtransferase